MVVIFQFTNLLPKVLKLNKAIISFFTVFIYGCKLLSLTLREEHILQASEHKDLRKMELREIMKTGNEV